MRPALASDRVRRTAGSKAMRLLATVALWLVLLIAVIIIWLRRA
jgi:hypothetical protein